MLLVLVTCYCFCNCLERKKLENATSCITGNENLWLNRDGANLESLPVGVSYIGLFQQWPLAGTAISKIICAILFLIAARNLMREANQRK